MPYRRCRFLWIILPALAEAREDNESEMSTPSDPGYQEVVASGQGATFALSAAKLVTGRRTARHLIRKDQSVSCVGAQAIVAWIAHKWISDVPITNAV